MNDIDVVLDAYRYLAKLRAATVPNWIVDIGNYSVKKVTKVDDDAVIVIFIIWDQPDSSIGWAKHTQGKNSILWS